MQKIRLYVLALSHIGTFTVRHTNYVNQTRVTSAHTSLDKVQNGCRLHAEWIALQVMCIPGQVSSDDPRAERSFKLNLAKIHGDPNGSFDCIQQSSSG